MPTLKQIDQKIAQLREQRASMVARETAAKRKRATRAKILLGAGVLRLVGKGDAPATEVYAAVRRALNPSNAKLFAQWEADRSAGDEEEGSGDEGSDDGSGDAAADAGPSDPVPAAPAPASDPPPALDLDMDASPGDKEAGAAAPEDGKPRSGLGRFLNRGAG